MLIILVAVAIFVMTAVQFADFVPVDVVPEAFDKLSALVLVIKIIRVFPDIEREYGSEIRQAVNIMFFQL